ncbi:hypothetical protein OSB04_019874 [Centaurea solstitialis]|uniref:RRM domain-containing protein n=1 Tax=Centaurea solstitialis TaxID=347529 RepID=A0AA38T2L7_9ASTR|nr:hypothetical protein OSB04_019874 [Centaurea solstitialis]
MENSSLLGSDSLSGSASTFFFTNFPEQESKSSHWKIFKKFGVLVDLYIARKRSRWGKRFGFARFVKVVDWRGLEEKLNGIWIGSFRVRANLSRFSRKGGMRGGVPKKRPERQGYSVPSQVVRSRDASSSRTYTDAVKGVTAAVEERIVLTPSVDALERLDSTLVGELKSFESLDMIGSLNELEGWADIRFSYLGGFSFQLDFPSKSSALDFLHGAVDYWKDWFVSLSHWGEGLRVPKRLAILEVQGLPLHVWSSDSLVLIGSRWGKVVKTELEGGKGLRKVAGFLWVLTDRAEWITEDMLELGEIIKPASASSSFSDDCGDVEGCFWKDCEDEETVASAAASSDDLQKDGDGLPDSSPEGLGEEGSLDLRNSEGKAHVSRQGESTDDVLGASEFPSESSEGPNSLNNKASQGMAPATEEGFSGSLYPLLEESDSPIEDEDGDWVLNLNGLGKQSKRSWVKTLVAEHNVKFLCIQETKTAVQHHWQVKSIWGQKGFDFASLDSSGNSSGILSVWDCNFFKLQKSVKQEGFVGDALGSRCAWVICEDFNEVWVADERRVFDSRGASAFNMFISSVGLSDIRLGGRKFTWMNSGCSKLSKLDRFLVNAGFINLWPSANSLALPRFISDHCPILLDSKLVDFGLTSFRTEFEVFSKVELLSKKLRHLKAKVKTWGEEVRNNSGMDVGSLKQKISSIDLLAELGSIDDSLVKERAELMANLGDLMSAKIADLKQKAKAKWLLEGDENSIFSMDRINDAARDFFEAKFAESHPVRPTLISPLFRKLSDSQRDCLETPFRLMRLKVQFGVVETTRPRARTGLHSNLFERIGTSWEMTFLKL